MVVGAIVFRGASGTVARVTGLEYSDSELVPIRFSATTVNVYSVPLVKPSIEIELDLVSTLLRMSLKCAPV